MTTWEYRLLEIRGINTRYDESNLNDLGREGWEAIAVWSTSSGHYVLLKRPISK